MTFVFEIDLSDISFSFRFVLANTCPLWAIGGFPQHKKQPALRVRRNPGLVLSCQTFPSSQHQRLVWPGHFFGSFLVNSEGRIIFEPSQISDWNCPCDRSNGFFL